MNALQPILASLMEKKLIIALTPPGRGQLITHNLYLPEELENLRAKIAAGGDDEGARAIEQSSERFRRNWLRHNRKSLN